MRVIVTFLFVTLFTLSGKTQVLRDTLFGVRVLKSDIVDGVIQPNPKIVYHRLYDSTGRLKRDITFSDNDGFPHDFSVYTYSNSRNINDRYVNERLQQRRVIYITNGHTEREVLYRVAGKDTAIIETINYRLNQAGKPIYAVCTNSKGKKEYVVRYRYDAKGEESYRKVLVKQGFPSDSIVLRKCDMEYSSVSGSCIRMVTTIVKKDHEPEVFETKCDSTGIAIELIVKNSSGKVLYREEYKNNVKKKRVLEAKRFDADNRIVDHTIYLYERYGSAGSNQRIDDN